MITEKKEQQKVAMKQQIAEMRKQLTECEARLNRTGGAKSSFMVDGEIHKDALAEHGEKLIHNIRQAIARMQKQVDDHTDKGVTHFEQDEKNLKAEMSKRAEAIFKMEAALNEDIPDEILDLEPYRKLVESQVLVLKQPVPEIKIMLKLSDLSKQTDKQLIGEVKCSSNAARRNPAFTQITQVILTL
eukprot:GHVU01059637.1.p1 GENE.GHVU01059637.1~~GHVU01059637.1.p1  ORF type:complete len:197 (-),score=41.34 GHVU01059637.1:97-657(-)